MVHDDLCECDACIETILGEPCEPISAEKFERILSKVRSGGMVWYKWKVWRFAWALNRGGVVSDSSGRWVPLVGHLVFRVR